MAKGRKATGGAFKPGADPRRNMKGRPRRGTAFTDILRSVGEEPGTMEAVARRVWEMAKSGSMAAVSFLADRLDGRVADRLTLEEEPLSSGIDFDALGAFIAGEEIPPEKIPDAVRQAAALTPLAQRLAGRGG